MLHKFTLKNHGQNFTNIKFVASVTDKKNDNPLKRIIKVNGHCFLATDGSRLHHAIVANHNLPNGWYEVVRNTKTIIHLKQVDALDFPDVKFPFQESRNINPKQYYEFDFDENWGIDNVIFEVARHTPEDFVFNISFFEPLLDDHWNVQVPSEEPKMLIAKNNTKTALIMPKRF